MWADRWKSLREEFDSKFKQFLLVLDECDLPDREDTKEYQRELISHNLSDGKRIRGTLVAAVVEACTGDCQDEKLRNQAHMTGWCIEMIHAGFLILDDIVDNSYSRRGRPSWFKVKMDAGQGLLAIIDGVQLILTAKHMLSKIFTTDACDQQAFLKVAHLFDEVVHQTGWGQNMDTRYARLNSNAGDGTVDLTSFTREAVNKISQWKTGYYTFYLPIACGMAIAGVTDANVLTQTKSILLQLGQYFQAQDDYLDCFGDPNVMGKVGTDIADGKCTWLIAECLARASPEQIDVIKHHYGRSDSASINLVQDVYNSLELARQFKTYEAEMHKNLAQLILNLHLDSGSGLPDILQFLIDLLFGRSH